MLSAFLICRIWHAKLMTKVLSSARKLRFLFGMDELDGFGNFACSVSGW